MWRGAFFVALGTLTWLSLAPQERLPPINLWDKLAHAVAFAVLATLIHAGWPRARQAALWGTLVAFGLLMEVLQIPAPGRNFSLLDLVADAAGIAAYAAAARCLPGLLPLGRAS
jgi:VanZ family protein